MKKKLRSIDDIKQAKLNLKRKLEENESYLKLDIEALRNNSTSMFSGYLLQSGLRFATRLFFKNYYLAKGLTTYKFLKRLGR